ncbi:centrosomal protein of 89 kDa [Polypterus senegalus]|uniref:centrosomal protein of 89 kDa n=1 Tax=Polypterus senegalus TaxID=55291 RepID=UPI00196510FA|nr:centrosomal protein of 89 kDa [Polypterus senegalus]
MTGCNSLSFFRSALAPAILATTLAGRTVAIPPVRCRSYSDSDALPSETPSLVQPYASISEFQRERNSPSAIKRPRMPSPKFDEHFNFALEGTEESSMEEKVYSMVNRKAISPASDNNEIIDGSIHVPVSSEVQSENLEIFEDRDSSQRCTTNNEDRRQTSPNHSQDMTDSKRKHLQDSCQTKYSNRKQRLTSENQELTHQLTQQTVQLQKLQLKQELLEHVRNTLQEYENEPGKSPQLHSIREHIQELVDENNDLKIIVHNLNLELGRYQTKYRPLLKTELDVKCISPLILAYEDRLKEKHSQLQDYEEEMKIFRAHVEELVRENELLHHQMERSNTFVSKEKWEQFQEQAKLVLEENQLLMEQLELQQTKTKEVNSKHVWEVSKLSKQLMILEAEKQHLQEELVESQKQLESFKYKYKNVKSALQNMVRMEDHISVVNEHRRHRQDEVTRKQAEFENSLDRIAALQVDKQTLLLENTTLTADNKSLEAELEISQKKYRKHKRKANILKQQLDEAMGKEIASHQYLANMIRLAEKTSQERDQFMHMALAMENDKHGTLNKIIEDTIRLSKLEERVKVYKNKASAKLKNIGDHLLKKDEEFADMADTLKKEIKHLTTLLQDKQNILDDVMQQKREIENEVEIVWESAAKESRRLKNNLVECLHNRSITRFADMTFLEEHFSSVPTHPSTFHVLNYQELASPATDKIQHFTGQNQNIDSVFSMETPANRNTVSASMISKMKKMENSIMLDPNSDQCHSASLDKSETNALDFYS